MTEGVVRLSTSMFIFRKRFSGLEVPCVVTLHNFMYTIKPPSSHRWARLASNLFIYIVQKKDVPPLSSRNGNASGHNLEQG